MKRPSRRLLFIILQILVVAVLLEASGRALWPQFVDDSEFLDDAFLHLLNSGVTLSPDSANFSRRFGWVLSPNTESAFEYAGDTYISTINSLGFRSREIQPRTDNEYRVMLVGDSMFFGTRNHEVDTIASILERLGRPHLSVYNYSVSGYNTVQELIVARTYVEPLTPDHIILGFFIANDILPNAIARVDNQGNYGTSPDTEETIRQMLRARLGPFMHSTVLKAIADRVYLPRWRYEVSIMDEVIAKSYSLIAELERLATENDVRFSMVILYPKDAVQGGIVQTWSKSRIAGELLHAFCDEYSIEVLDLIEYMNTSEDKERYFLKDDGHPNGEGNAIIAKAMYGNLVEPHVVQ